MCDSVMISRDGIQATTLSALRLLLPHHQTTIHIAFVGKKWAHHIVNVYWQHKRFSVTNSMINLRFVPISRSRYHHRKWKLEIPTFREFKMLLTSSILFTYIWFCEMGRTTTLFQLCPYCFCYHHSCCFKLHCDWHIRKIINVMYTDCNFPEIV